MKFREQSRLKKNYYIHRFKHNYSVLLIKTIPQMHRLRFKPIPQMYSLRFHCSPNQLYKIGYLTIDVLNL